MGISKIPNKVKKEKHTNYKPYLWDSELLYATDRLKPCPFCGNKPIIINGYEGYKIACTQYYTCEEHPCTRNHNIIEDAIEAWNKRVGD